MNNKISAYSSDELYRFQSHLMEHIRYNGLPKGYASGLPYHEAKRNYIKASINDWKKSKAAAFEQAKRREAQLLKEQANLREAEEQKKQATVASKEARFEEIKLQRDAEYAKKKKIEAEQQRLQDVKRQQEDELKKQAVEAEQQRLQDIKRQQEEAEKKKKIEAEQQRLQKLKRQQEEEAEKKKKIEAEQQRLQELKRQQEDEAEKKKKELSINKLFTEAEENLFFKNFFPSENQVAQTSYNNVLGFDKQKQNINASQISQENPEVKKISSVISSFNEHNKQEHFKIIKSPFEVENSIKYLDNLNVSFNITDDPENVLRQVSSCFQNVSFSLKLNQSDIIKTHQLVYQEAISELYKNFPTNNSLNYYHNIVNANINSLYKKIGTYLLFLHYMNALIIIKSKNDENIQKTSFKYFDELIYQASFLFNRIYELKFKLEKHFSIIDFKQQNIALSDLNNVIECLTNGINQIIDIYSNYILNNYLLFTLNDNANSIQYSIYLSSKVPEINNVFSQQLNEIVS